MNEHRYWTEKESRDGERESITKITTACSSITSTSNFSTTTTTNTNTSASTSTRTNFTATDSTSTGFTTNLDRENYSIDETEQKNVKSKLIYRK